MCQECDKEITSPDGKKFCSRSCSAKFNNRKYPKRKKQERVKETRACSRDGCENTFDSWVGSKKRFCGCRKPFIRDKKFILDRVVVDENECWVWQRSVHKAGYGQLGVKPYNAHVLAYTLWRGPPSSEVVRHLCHNALCCNPEHLEEGTHKDNYRDSLEAHRRADTKRKGAPAHNRKPVVFRGEKYSSISEAIRKCRVTHSTVINECILA